MNDPQNPDHVKNRLSPMPVLSPQSFDRPLTAADETDG